MIAETGILKYLGISLGSLSAFAGGALSIVWYSDYLTANLLNTIKPQVPGLSWDSVSGNLNSGLTFHGLRYVSHNYQYNPTVTQAPDGQTTTPIPTLVDVYIPTITTQIKLSCLIQGNLCLDQVQVIDPKVVIATGNEQKLDKLQPNAYKNLSSKDLAVVLPPPPTTAGGIPSWLDINLKNTKITGLSLVIGKNIGLAQVAVNQQLVSEEQGFQVSQSASQRSKQQQLFAEQNLARNFRYVPTLANMQLPGVPTSVYSKFTTAPVVVQVPSFQAQELHFTSKKLTLAQVHTGKLAVTLATPAATTAEQQAQALEQQQELALIDQQQVKQFEQEQALVNPTPNNVDQALTAPSQELVLAKDAAGKPVITAKTNPDKDHLLVITLHDVNGKEVQHTIKHNILPIAVKNLLIQYFNLHDKGVSPAYKQLASTTQIPLAGETNHYTTANFSATATDTIAPTTSNATDTASEQQQVSKDLAKLPVVATSKFGKQLPASEVTAQIDHALAFFQRPIKDFILDREQHLILPYQLDTADVNLGGVSLSFVSYDGSKFLASQAGQASQAQQAQTAYQQAIKQQAQELVHTQATAPLSQQQLTALQAQVVQDQLVTPLPVPANTTHFTATNALGTVALTPHDGFNLNYLTANGKIVPELADFNLATDGDIYAKLQLSYDARSTALLAKLVTQVNHLPQVTLPVGINSKLVLLGHVNKQLKLNVSNQGDNANLVLGMIGETDQPGWPLALYAKFDRFHEQDITISPITLSMRGQVDNLEFQAASQLKIKQQHYSINALASQQAKSLWYEVNVLPETATSAVAKQLSNRTSPNPQDPLVQSTYQVLTSIDQLTSDRVHDHAQEQQQALDPHPAASSFAQLETQVEQNLQRLAAINQALLSQQHPNLAPLEAAFDSHSHAQPLATQQALVHSSGKVLQQIKASLNQAMADTSSPANVSTSNQSTAPTSTQRNTTSLTLNPKRPLLNLVGNVGYAHQALQTRSRLRIQQLDVTKLATIPNIKQLSSNADISFLGWYNSQQDWTIQLNRVNLQGSINQQPYTLVSKLGVDAVSGLDVDALTARYLSNKVDISGQINAAMNFNVLAQVNNLQTLVPGLDINLDSNLNLFGDFYQQSIQGQVSLPTLSYQRNATNININNANLNVDMAYSGKLTGNAQLTVGKSQFNNAFLLDQAQVTYQGLPENLVTLDLVSNQASLKAKLTDLNYDEYQNISGVLDLQNLDVLKAYLTGITTPTPIAFNYDILNKQALVQPFSLLNQDLDVAVTEPVLYTPDQLQTTIQVRKLNLGYLDHFLTKTDTSLEGIVAATAKIDIDPTNLQKASNEVNLTLNSSQVVVNKKVKFNTLKVKVADINSTANLYQNNLVLNNQMVINSAPLLANVVVSDLWKQRNLSGAVKLDALSLKVIEPLLDNTQRINGDFSTDITLGGTLDKPLVYGKTGFSKLKIAMVDMPFEVDSGDLVANVNGNQADVTGNLQTDTAPLVLNGGVDWSDPSNINSTVKINSKNLKVNLYGYGRTLLDADLTAEFVGKDMIIRGSGVAHDAQLFVPDKNKGYIAPSDDIVYVNNDYQPIVTSTTEKSSGGENIDLKVGLTLGKNINFNSYGVDANLAGNLNFNYLKHKFGIFGAVTIPQGTFQQYGQNLIIQKGNIVFNGVNLIPTLDIKAIRNPAFMFNSNVTVGLQVTGLANKPVITLFSTPSMSEAQKINYLLTGSDSNEVGEVGLQLLTSSLSSSLGVVERFGEAFGIKNLQLSTAKSGENSQITLSGTVLNKLRVNYAYGLFNGLSEISASYRLFPKIFVRVSHGLSDAIDMVYSVQW